MKDELTYLERLIKKIQNHKLTALILAFGIVVVSIGSFTHAIKNICDFVLAFKQPNTSPQSPALPANVNYPPIPENSIFRGVLAAAVYQTDGETAAELPLHFTYPVAPIKIWVRFVQTDIRYYVYFEDNSENRFSIPGLDETFFELPEDYNEVHVALHDFEGDNNPEIILAIYGEQASEFKGCVIKYYGATDRAQRFRDENWKVLGSFHGQHYARTDEHRLICPVGSQGDRWEFHLHEDRLREWDYSSESFVTEPGK
jgi:hypothetical protein